MKVIGLTGNSGSGKSTVAQYFKDKYNACIIDADKIGHQMLLKHSKAFDDLLHVFGKKVLDDDGNISRKKLREVVFTDSHALTQLNKISHYHICRDIFDKISRIKEYDKGKYSAIIVDAAVLLQSELKDNMEVIWVVIAEENSRLDRLVDRDNLSREDIQKRLTSQWNNENYIQFADEVINNRTTLNELFKTCDRLYEKYLLDGGTE